MVIGSELQQYKNDNRMNEYLKYIYDNDMVRTININDIKCKLVIIM